MKIFIITLLILGYAITAQAEQIDDKIIYVDSKGKVIMDTDKVDYFIFRNRRVTFEGIIDMIVQKRMGKFISELKKEIFR